MNLLISNHDRDGTSTVNLEERYYTLEFKKPPSLILRETIAFKQTNKQTKKSKPSFFRWLIESKEELLIITSGLLIAELSVFIYV